MSVNCTAVIAAPYVGQSLEPFLTEAEFGREHKQRFGKVPCAEHAGGANAWSDTSGGVWVAEFDYVRPDELVDWFKSLPWSEYDVATLTVQHESDDAMVAVAMNGRVGCVITRPINMLGHDLPQIAGSDAWNTGEL